MSSSSRVWYESDLGKFRSEADHAIVGALSQGSARGQFAVEPTQVAAWEQELSILRRELASFEGRLLLEFEIPRLGRRVDAIVIIDSVVFAIEFKVGEEAFRRAAIDQAWDYALDLKNFHEASHSAAIVPILVATDAPAARLSEPECDPDLVFRPICVTADGLRVAIQMALERAGKRTLDEHLWALAPYRPTPTIIEAARSLYANHSVESITRREADTTNLSITSARVEEIIEEARATTSKVICFVTGVPGAGKTLVGLNIATQRRDETSPTHAVFLSGNAPLVAVLRAALIRDDRQRRRAKKGTRASADSSVAVKAFIQNVHHFRDAYLKDLGAPADRVVIFDEAQRAWNREKTCDFMRRKKGEPNFSMSEPEFLISCMDRHPDWAVVVCLVGGGQEIHLGEAGINEWMQAVVTRFPHWKMYVSDRLTDHEYQTNVRVEDLAVEGKALTEPALHLSVALRSFRAEHVSRFVKVVLDGELDQARTVLKSFHSVYPIVLARDLGKAKEWIRQTARGSERYGLVASSKAQRLKPHAVDVRVDVDPVHYFLDGREDVRSSYYLEDAATEFQVQGLELDWVCVAWDGDLRRTADGWTHHRFKGSRWERIKTPEARAFLKNAYRVLLTRARQGMVIVVPEGDQGDPTRAPAFYDDTYEYLRSTGLPTIP